MSTPDRAEPEFPILKATSRGYRISAVPWSFIEPAREQAMKNHDQTLERLAQRGGLDPTEILAVLERRAWKNMSDEVALNAIEALLEAYGEPPMDAETERFADHEIATLALCEGCHATVGALAREVVRLREVERNVRGVRDDLKKREKAAHAESLRGFNATYYTGRSDGLDWAVDAIDAALGDAK